MITFPPRWLCLTNLFCWSSLVCYSLYFTDFVGQAVFRGNPRSGSKQIKIMTVLLTSILCDQGAGGEPGAGAV